MNDPPVSVCIPTYNGAAYLKECLDSILAQTFRNFEVLIVDDQSRDESYDLAQQYAARDSRFRALRNEHNLGLVGNWNHCAHLARGEWIKFLFQDDLLEPDCLEKLLAASRPEIPLVACRRRIIFEEDARHIEKGFSEYIERYSLDRIFGGATLIAPERFCTAVFDNWLKNFVGEPTAVLLHRSVFARFGFFNPELIQICDFEYWVRIASNTGLVYLPETLASFRAHGKATSTLNRNSRQFRSYLDELICYHIFLFDPVYQKLRLQASQCQPPLNLNQWFALWVRKAEKLARQAAKDPQHPDPSLLEDLRQVKQLFPGFGVVKKIPFSLRFDLYSWKLKNLFSSREVPEMGDSAGERG